MKHCVYNNAAGFLRIFDNGSDEHVFDPFDNTRIHPECYVKDDFAPKIVASALRVAHSPDSYTKNVMLLRKHVRRELDNSLIGDKDPAFKAAWFRYLEIG